MAVDVDAALKHMFTSGGSDLHIKVPAMPMMRLNGVLVAIPNTDKVMPDDALAALAHITRDKPEKFKEFEENGEVDFAYPLPGVARFRVNAFTQRGSCSIVMRAIGIDIKSADELMLPPAVKKLAEEERGVVLVTGTTGSGKSTTLAAMIKQINDREAKHIITLEDPIEFLHRDINSHINQREVGTDTGSFAQALRRVLRQDPDIIQIGEIRDLETLDTALKAADTGHLVFSTLHTTDATQTINRILSFYPPHQQAEVRFMLSSALAAVVSLRLVPRADRPGRVPAAEILINTAAVRDNIRDMESSLNIPELIREGTVQYGMQSFDQSLMGWYTEGVISYDHAVFNATNPSEFALRVQGVAGSSDTSWDAFQQGRSGDGSPGASGRPT